MGQFTPATASRLHLLAILFIAIIFANNNHVSANRINGKSNPQHHQALVNEYSNEGDEVPYGLSPDALPHVKNYTPDSDELSSRDIWSRLLGSGYTRSSFVHRPNYLPPASKFALRHGEVHFIPYNKRTIPIELQKALYAHGIVGRRR